MKCFLGFATLDCRLLLLCRKLSKVFPPISDSDSDFSTCQHLFCRLRSKWFRLNFFPGNVAGKSFVVLHNRLSEVYRKKKRDFAGAQVHYGAINKLALRPYRSTQPNSAPGVGPESCLWSMFMGRPCRGLNVGGHIYIFIFPALCVLATCLNMAQS